MGGPHLMGFADDLLEQAYHLLNKDGDDPKEASLRRAVSTAYYALFHLLIDEAVSNWGIIRQRSNLARMFELLLRSGEKLPARPQDGWLDLTIPRVLIHEALRVDLA
jgi:hypothetical protein